MRLILDTLIVGAVVAVLALPAGAPAGGSGNRQEPTGRSLRIGLGVRVDPDKISLNGSWSVTPSSDDATGHGGANEVTIGAVPNLATRARKGAALVRVARSTTICVAKHLLKELIDEDRREEQ